MIAAALLSSLPAVTIAHETRPAIMDLTLGESAEATLTMNAEAWLAGIDLSVWEDTNEAPEAAAYDALRALPPGGLADALMAEGIGGALVSEGLGAWDLLSVEVIPEPDAELPRDTVLALSAPVTGDVRIGPSARLGNLILRQEDEAAFAGLVAPGALSPVLEGARGGFWGWLGGLFGG